MEKRGIGKDLPSLDLIFTEMMENPKSKEAGCAAFFVGFVRGETKEGKAVEGLFFESYEKKALEAFDSIIQSLESRPGITEVRIYHKVGDLKVGDKIVIISVMGGHREQVFPVLAEAVERMKLEATIWKKEITPEKSYWIEY